MRASWSRAVRSPTVRGSSSIVDAASEEEIAERLEDDPWAPTRLLRTASIEQWHVLLGGIGPDHPGT